MNTEVLLTFSLHRQVVFGGLSFKVVALQRLAVSFNRKASVGYIDQPQNTQKLAF